MPIGNEKTSSAASKALDSNAESPNIVQPEKANPEDFNSAEDPPIKKSDDVDIDEGNARDGVDDKDAMGKRKLSYISLSYSSHLYT